MLDSKDGSLRRLGSSILPLRCYVKSACLYATLPGIAACVIFISVASALISMMSSLSPGIHINQTSHRGVYQSCSFQDATTQADRHITDCRRGQRRRKSTAVQEVSQRSWCSAEPRAEADGAEPRERANGTLLVGIESSNQGRTKFGHQTIITQSTRKLTSTVSKCAGGTPYTTLSIAFALQSRRTKK